MDGYPKRIAFLDKSKKWIFYFSDGTRREFGWVAVDGMEQDMCEREDIDRVMTCLDAGHLTFGDY